MDTKVEPQPATFIDTAKLLLAVAIVMASVVGFYYFPNAPIALRSLGVLAALAVAALVALQSAQGQSIWKFIQASWVELRKVVWPTREETIQTTIAVLVFALIGGTFFFLLDVLLAWLSSKLTGQGA
jgi:preprotein translocase subunit SecE